MSTFPKDEHEPLVETGIPPEGEHLTVHKYKDADRVEAPDWYDDNINVGDDQ